jgi:hypothetical protein
MNNTNMTVLRHFSLYLVNCTLQREMFQTKAMYRNEIYILCHVQMSCMADLGLNQFV